MPPAVLLMPWATPADLAAPWPVLPAHVFEGLVVKSCGAAPARYFSKFSVVPDSSERKNTLMSWAGSEAPEFTLAIAASFHLVIFPWKICATSCGVRTSLSTPGALYATAIGPATSGRFQASFPAQRFLASSVSELVAPSAAAVFSAESEPGQSAWPPLTDVMPAPDPVAL